MLFRSVKLVWFLDAKFVADRPWLEGFAAVYKAVEDLPESYQDMTTRTAPWATPPFSSRLKKRTPFEAASRYSNETPWGESLVSLPNSPRANISAVQPGTVGSIIADDVITGANPCRVRGAGQAKRIAANKFRRDGHLGDDLGIGPQPAGVA